jgi:hypothetical protein
MLAAVGAGVGAVLLSDLMKFVPVRRIMGQCLAGR